MNNNPMKRKLSFGRLLVVLLVVVILISAGAPFVYTAFADLKIGGPATWFAPYVDVTLTPILHFEDGAEELADDVVLGFIVADPNEPCRPTWGTYYDLDAAARALDLDRRIVRLRERGGDVIVSFGGASNMELALACEDVGDLTTAYQSVIERYELNAIDLDIEGAAIANTEANDRRAQALRRLRDDDPSLEIWLTLPVAPHGLDEPALALIQQLLQNGVELNGVNLMIMNYAESRPSGMSMQMANEQALTRTVDQLNDLYLQEGRPRDESQLWHMIGATPMIGQNDVDRDVFEIEDAGELLRFARNNELGRLSFWSLNRDMPCGLGTDLERVSNTCSGVSQEPHEFTKIFMEATRKRLPNSNNLGNQINEMALGLANSLTNLSPEILGDNIPLDLGPVSDNQILNDETFIRFDPDTSPYPLWRSEKAYDGGVKVVWQGRVYQAKWWTQGDRPDAPVDHVWDTPWRYLGPILESDREAVQQTPELKGNWSRWSVEEVFLAGDEVEYKDQVFRAKWWTQGVTPQQFPDQPYDNPWEYLGDVDCNGDSCGGEGVGATLAIDYESLSSITFEIHQDDEVPGAVGRLLQGYINQNGKKTYEVLRGRYDLVASMAAQELIVDSVQCQETMCETVDIAGTLSVDYNGLSGIRLEIRTDDGVEGTAGDLVYLVDDQSGNRSYSVLHGRYDLVFNTGSTELIVDNLDCRDDDCAVENINALLSVDYGGLAGINLEIRDSDGITGTTGTALQVYTDQKSQKSYPVLRGVYDLVFEKGAAEMIIDDLDCTGLTCSVSDIGSELAVTYGEKGSTIEIREHDQEEGAHGALVEMFEGQSGWERYGVLRGVYDVLIETENASNSHEAVDCTEGHCTVINP